MRRSSVTSLLLLLLLPVAGTAQSTASAGAPGAGDLLPEEIVRYAVDPSHTSVEFSVRHLGLSRVRGTIPVQSGAVMLHTGDLGRSSVTVVFDVASLNTGNARRDQDLNENYFRTAEHPRGTFVSTRVDPTPTGLRISGELTLAGTTVPVVFDATDLGTWEAPDGTLFRRGWEAETSLNRHDLGVAHPGSPAEVTGVIGDEVTITIQLEVLRQNPSGIAFDDGESVSVGTRYRGLVVDRSPTEAARALAAEVGGGEEFNTGIREFLVLSLQLLWEGEGAAAAEVLRLATDLHPDAARLWELRSEALWRAGRGGEAHQAAIHARELDAGSAVALEFVRLTRS